jgi:type I restriction enzyme R subunit
VSRPSGRIEKTHEGNIALEADGEVKALFDGRGKQHEPDQAPLSEIINVINERFGLNLDEADRLLLEQYKAEMVADEDLAAQAKANTLENFKLVFERSS